MIKMGKKAVIKGVTFDVDEVTEEEKEMLLELDEKGYLFVFDREAFNAKYGIDKQLNT